MLADGRADRQCADDFPQGARQWPALPGRGKFCQTVAVHGPVTVDFARADFASAGFPRAGLLKEDYPYTDLRGCAISQALFCSYFVAILYRQYKQWQAARC